MSEAARIHLRNAQGRHHRRATAFRWSALITGGALALIGLSKRSKSGVAIATAGGLLSYAGAKVGTERRELIARSSILLNCTPEQAYQFWSNFENLPLFMRHLESVTRLGESRSRWIAIGPLGKRVIWDAEIAFDRKDDVIAWRSLPDSEIYVDGIVKFRNAPGEPRNHHHRSCGLSTAGRRSWRSAGESSRQRSQLHDAAGPPPPESSDRGG